MIADSDCHHCGGLVGSHSDMCLDCGKDQPMPWDAKFLVALFIGGMILALIAGFGK